ncbi:hypothetical protein LX16_4866 [Stackebrandtia albiflava]|uniref:Helix-turn-helix protein n=1 Tax=Stackebrandtia albiflava TaxID=406432 RepID=A0A562UQ28_9ACTN|nr:hypothetical protein LX16_4866 [Stackebrandtia albiflava]
MERLGRTRPSSGAELPSDVVSAGADGGGWSCVDVLALPPVIDVVTAGSVLGIGRTKAYTLARTDTFPCRVIRAGRTYLVPTAALWRLLDLYPPRPADAAE